MDFKKKSRPFFTIIFKLKNDNFKTQDFSPLIERVLAGVKIPPKPDQKFTKTDLVLLTTSEAAADGIEDIACTLFPTMTRPLLSDVVVLLL